MRVELKDGGLWRPMTSGDLAAVMSVGDEVHAAYPEDDATQVERLALYPEGCAVLEHRGAVAG